MQRAWTALLLMLGLLVSMIIEALDWPRLGMGLRGGVIGWYLWKELPRSILIFRGNKMLKCISFGIWSLPSAYLLGALLPAYRIAWVHWSLVGGLSALSLFVATRVILGHSGQIKILQQKGIWMVVMMVLIWVGMISRVSGDIWPKIMKSHYIYGAVCWAAAVLIWCFKILPKVLDVDEEDSPCGQG